MDEGCIGHLTSQINWLKEKDLNCKGVTHAIHEVGSQIVDLEKQLSCQHSFKRSVRENTLQESAFLKSQIISHKRRLEEKNNELLTLNNQKEQLTFLSQKTTQNNEILSNNLQKSCDQKFDLKQENQNLNEKIFLLKGLLDQNNSKFKRTLQTFTQQKKQLKDSENMIKAKNQKALLLTNNLESIEEKTYALKGMLTENQKKLDEMPIHKMESELLTLEKLTQIAFIKKAQFKNQESRFLKKQECQINSHNCYQKRLVDLTRQILNEEEEFSNQNALLKDQNLLEKKFIEKKVKGEITNVNLEKKIDNMQSLSHRLFQEMEKHLIVDSLIKKLEISNQIANC